jgi:hypothetical protein
MLETLFSALGLKKVVVLAGLLGGAISGGIMPGPLAVLQALWARVATGAVCGSVLAGYGAQPLLFALDRPDTYLPGAALGLGLFGLSFAFKVMKAWNEFDLGGTLGRLIDKLMEKIK